MPTKKQVQEWVAPYERAWRSNAQDDIASLFAADGRDTAAIGGTGVYKELGTFDEHAKCTVFRMWNNQV